MDNTSSPSAPLRIDPLAQFFAPLPVPQKPMQSMSDGSSARDLFPHVAQQASSSTAASIPITLANLASHGLYTEILKVCQEQFHNEKGNVPLQTRLAHMMAKLALYDVAHVQMHLSQLAGGNALSNRSSSANDLQASGTSNVSQEPFMMRFMRVWVREWVQIDKERPNGRKMQSSSAKTPLSASRMSYSAASLHRDDTLDYATTLHYTPLRDEIWNLLKLASEYVHYKSYTTLLAQNHTPNGGLSLLHIMGQRRRHPMHMKHRQLEQESDLRHWRSREVTICCMIVNLSLFKEDFSGALRMCDYLVQYVRRLYTSQQGNDESREYATKYDWVVTPDILTSLISVHGRILLQIGYVEQAAKKFAEIEKLNPESHWVTLNEALITFVKQDYVKCRKILEEKRQVLEKEVQQEQEEQASVPALERTQRVLPFLVEVVNNISMTYYYQNDLQAAVNNLELYIKQNPSSALDICTVHNLCKYYDLQSEVGSKHKKKILRKLVKTYRLVDYPQAVYLLSS